MITATSTVSGKQKHKVDLQARGRALDMHPAPGFSWAAAEHRPLGLSWKLCRLKPTKTRAPVLQAQIKPANLFRGRE